MVARMCINGKPAIMLVETAQIMPSIIDASLIRIQRQDKRLNNLPWNYIVRMNLDVIPHKEL